MLKNNTAIAVRSKINKIFEHRMSWFENTITSNLGN